MMHDHSRHGALRLTTWLKLIFILLFFSCVITLIVAAFLPSAWSIERRIEIHAAPEQVFARIADLRRWPEWTVWTRQQDPTLTMEYFGPPQGPEAGSRWQGKTLGKGSMRVTALEPNARLEYTLMLQDGVFPSQGALVLEARGDTTRVTWSMHGDVGGNLLARLFIRSMESYMGPDLETGLRQLKTVTEAD